MRQIGRYFSEKQQKKMKFQVNMEAPEKPLKKVKMEDIKRKLDDRAFKKNTSMKKPNIKKEYTLAEKQPKKMKFEENMEAPEKPLKKVKIEDFKRTLDGRAFKKNTGMKKPNIKKEYTRKNENKMSPKNKFKAGKKEKKISPMKKFMADPKKVSMKKKSDGEPQEKATKLCEMKWKVRKQERKKAENKVFEISAKAKSIWEELRRENCGKEKKEKLLKEIMNLIRGHVKQLIFAHDTARVIECIFAVGTEEHRNALFEELKDKIVALATSKYAKFFLIKILNYGTKQQKDLIVKALEGNIVSLVRHTEAAAVVECAYNEYASAIQRTSMMQEFYGPAFKFFKDETCYSLSELLAKEPTQKNEILKFMKETLLRLAEKSVIRHSIVHHALREYLESSNESGRAEVAQAIHNGLVEILHTKDGARVAMMCIWSSSTKDRKTIVKSMKTHIVKIAKEEQGHMVLLAIFDSLDDTKLVERVILHELMQGLMELINDQFGRKVLLYLLSRRNSHYFHPDIVNILKRGDDNPYSKKDTDARQEELRQSASEDLMKFVTNNVKHLLSTNPKCMLLLAILKHASGDASEVLKALADLLTTPYNQLSGEDMHFVENVGLSFVLKKLLKESSEEKTNNATRFATLLIETVPSGVFGTWIECNRGAFLLLNLLETEIPSVVKRVKKELHPVQKTLSTKKFKGAELLLKKLSE